MALRWIGALVEPPMAELTRWRCESLRGQDVGGLQILQHHVDDALAGLIGHLPRSR
jgi:hypothetical protein